MRHTPPNGSPPTASAFRSAKPRLHPARAAPRPQTSLSHYLLLSAPLFCLVMLGYGIGHLRFWKRTWTKLGEKLVFAIPLPALLFHMLSDLRSAPAVDSRLLIAFFGSCFVVFAIGRAIAALVFDLDGVAQSVFGLAGVFSNNVLLGVPLARMALGPEAMPCVALVLVFNALTLWTLVTVSVEWARHGELSFAGLKKTLRSVLRNPIIVAILCGTAFGLSGLQLPETVDRTLALVGRSAGPTALLVLGLGISQYGVQRELRQSLTICAIKLLLQPAVVWLLATWLGLPMLERQVVVLLASLSVGANVYLMAAQFETLQGAVASSLVLSTALAAFTTPLVLAVVTALG